MTELPDNKIPILHIGYPKTATTWFQKSYFPLVKDIDLLRHHDLPLYFLRAKGPADIDRSKTFFERFKSRLVISDENMVGGEKEDMIYTHPFKYKEVFGDAIIIVFLRNQLEKYASNYGQFVKKGGKHSLEYFLFRDREDFVFGGRKHSYDTVLGNYIKAFGKERVFIYLFEDFREEPRGFIRDFTHKFGFDIDLTRVSYHRENVSLPVSAIKIKRSLNHLTRKTARWDPTDSKKALVHIPGWYPATYLLFDWLTRARAFSSNNGAADLFDEATLKKLANYFAPSNHKLSNQLGVKNLEKHNYPLPSTISAE
jgi:hypothetical protein